MDVLPLLLFAIAMTITPGPNNLMILASGLNHGVRLSLPHYLGICLGFPSMTFAMNLGLASIFTRLPWLYPLLKVAGTLYLLYLAWRIAVAQAPREREARGQPLGFWQAALFQWVNPKAWVMGLGAIATFGSPDMGPLQQALLLTGAYLLAAFPCVGAWLMLGEWMRSLLHNHRHLLWFNRGMAALLVASIVPMFTGYMAG